MRVVLMMAALLAVMGVARGQAADPHAGHSHDQGHAHDEPARPAGLDPHGYVETPAAEAELAAREAQWRAYPAVAARFEQAVESTEGGAPQRRSFDWCLWRSVDRIETSSGEGGEVWQRDPHRQVFYHRVFPREKRRITYHPGDLASLNIRPDWDRLLTMVPRAELDRLTRDGEVAVLGRTAERYVGKLHGEAVEVHWLADVRLPAMVRRTSAAGVTVTVLKELHPLESAPWPRADLDALHVDDFADIGDRETDPFLRKFMHQFHGDAHAH